MPKDFGLNISNAHVIKSNLLRKGLKHIHLIACIGQTILMPSSYLYIKQDWADL